MNTSTLKQFKLPFPFQGPFQTRFFPTFLQETHPFSTTFPQTEIPCLSFLCHIFYTTFNQPITPSPFFPRILCFLRGLFQHVHMANFLRALVSHNPTAPLLLFHVRCRGVQPITSLFPPYDSLFLFSCLSGIVFVFISSSVIFCLSIFLSFLSYSLFSFFVLNAIHLCRLRPMFFRSFYYYAYLSNTTTPLTGFSAFFSEPQLWTPFSTPRALSVSFFFLSRLLYKSRFLIPQSRCVLPHTKQGVVTMCCVASFCCD